MQAADASSHQILLRRQRRLAEKVAMEKYLWASLAEMLWVVATDPFSGLRELVNIFSTATTAESRGTCEAPIGSDGTWGRAYCCWYIDSCWTAASCNRYNAFNNVLWTVGSTGDTDSSSYFCNIFTGCCRQNKLYRWPALRAAKVHFLPLVFHPDFIFHCRGLINIPQ